jgi:nanoRNase/pAp phosphatase (c-di-AMP/oligoRNAs hydrolase)
MPHATADDERGETPGHHQDSRAISSGMTTEIPARTPFVESCVETVAGQAAAVERRTRRHPRAARLVRLLAGKRNILLTAHEHPDPDAFAAALGLCTLLAGKLAEAKFSVSFKGRLGGGVNDVFYREAPLAVLPWDESKLGEYDAIILLDTQPSFAYSPLPPTTVPTAVIDHHRSGRGHKPKCSFCDIRTDVGATTSIIFSYFMELEAPISPSLAAAMLYAIESDLAGAAGTPGELDNIALSGLTLKADTGKLYRMRYAPLPRSYYAAYAAGINKAMLYGTAIFSYLGAIDSFEKPAVLADFLLRGEEAEWALVTALYEDRMVLSLRTRSDKIFAGELMQRIVRGLGEGGGHRTKAGGIIPLSGRSGAADIDRLRSRIRQRYLRALEIPVGPGQKLVP